MYIECVLLLSRDAPTLWRNTSATRAVDGWAVCFHETANVLQYLDCLVGQFAVWTRADVEQEVGIQTCRRDETTNEFVAIFIVSVGNAITPGVVHRHACLQGKA